MAARGNVRWYSRGVNILWHKTLWRKYTQLTWKDCWPAVIVIAHALSLLFALVFPLWTGFDIFCYFCKGHKRHQYCKYLCIFGLRKTNSRFKKIKSHQYSSTVIFFYLVAYWAIWTRTFFTTLEKKMRIRIS